jgi:hypothetical protein
MNPSQLATMNSPPGNAKGALAGSCRNTFLSSDAGSLTGASESVKTEPALKEGQTVFGFFGGISSNLKKHREKSGNSPRLTKTRRIIGELL